MARNRKKQAKILAFSDVRNFRSLLRDVVYNMFFYNIIDMFFKVQF